MKRTTKTTKPRKTKFEKRGINSELSKKDFERYLERIEDPKNNQEVNYDLPENPTPLQVAKFDICQRILAYQEDNNLSDEELAKRVNLSIPELEEILFCQIEKFTLDSLIIYANKLFSPRQIEIIIRPVKPKTIHARI